LEDEVNNVAIFLMLQNATVPITRDGRLNRHECWVVHMMMMMMKKGRVSETSRLTWPWSGSGIICNVSAIGVLKDIQLFVFTKMYHITC